MRPSVREITVWAHSEWPEADALDRGFNVDYREIIRRPGWIEMVWHLYQWGDQVGVIEPEALRAMVEGFQRGDLGVLP